MGIGPHENAEADLAYASAAAALLAEAAELAAETAPRRYSVCALDVEAEDGAVLAWGLAFPGRAVLCKLDGRPAGTFVSAESSMRMLRRRGEVRLIWIDPDPCSAS
ncbi:hypothetical protein [Actinomadura alba]|uniref:Immunity protein 35 domain-containing protein n=1 Tax=Actinomadura alba TaxID=406431 RepID=A0ABR7LTW5_9ACTN|nr:hypothetical protein [Actinomadura alba]MBC6468246.1 hypothetical protein [Actinomadura alba]